MGVQPNATSWLAMVGRFQVKADISHTTTPAQIFENDPRRTLVGPCGRLVDFHDRLACLTCWPTRSRTIQILFFDLEEGKYPPAWSLPPCAAMNMATADRQ